MTYPPGAQGNAPRRRDHLRRPHRQARRTTFRSRPVSAVISAKLPLSGSGLIEPCRPCIQRDPSECRRAPVAVLQRTRKKKRRTGRSHPPSTVTPQSLPRIARSGSEIVGLSPFPDARSARAMSPGWKKLEQPGPSPKIPRLVSDLRPERGSQCENFCSLVWPVWR